MATTRTPKWSTIVLRTVGVTILVVVFIAIDIVALIAPSCSTTRLIVLLICSSIAILGSTVRLALAIHERLNVDRKIESSDHNLIYLLSSIVTDIGDIIGEWDLPPEKLEKLNTEWVEEVLGLVNSHEH